MAYRKSNGKLQNRRKKLQPAVLQMNFVVPTGSSYIDLGLCASILNRRGYKQQDHTWGVAQFEFLGDGVGVVQVQKLPETWVFQNAYTKSKALWEEMNDQVLDQEESIRGRYADFKIYMDDNMRQQTIQDDANQAGRILTPVQAVGGANQWTLADFSGGSPPADWNYSQLTIPNDPTSGATTNYYMHAVGPNTAASKGLIAGYELSRSRVQNPDPNVPTSNGWMTDLFDVGEQLDELRDVIEDDNDRPPYANPSSGSTAYYPGGSQEQPDLQVHSFCNFTPTTVSAKNRIQGGMFQNGLLKIVNGSDATLSLIVHLMPGTHRGYYCEEM